jgi:hypothetical protein
MLTTAVLLGALAFAPGQADKLTLANVRTLHGVLGVPRADNKLLPGDTVVIAFDIVGIQTDADGKANYSIGMDVSDAQGKVLFKQKPRKLEATASLGGNRLAAFATLDVGLSTKPGDYKVKVEVADLKANTVRNLTKTFKVLPAGFGVVRLTTTSDADGRYPAPALAAGQSVWVNFAAVGFERSQGKPNLAVSLRVLDERGRPTLPKPHTGEMKQELPAKVTAVPMQFLVALNRAGSFTVEISVTDKVAQKTSKLTFPLKVLETK